LWFSQKGTNLLRSPVVMTGMGPRSMSVRSPMRPPLPSALSHTSVRNSLMGMRLFTAFSWGRSATRSCQAPLSFMSLPKRSVRPTAFRKSLMPAVSHFQSSSESSTSLASAWLYPLCGPRKKILPPTMPTQGL
jgi:hypothetical protein